MLVVMLACCITDKASQERVQWERTTLQNKQFVFFGGGGGGGGGDGGRRGGDGGRRGVVVVAADVGVLCHRQSLKVVDLLKQISLTFWVEAKVSLNLE